MTWWDAETLARTGSRVRPRHRRDRWISFDRGLFLYTPVNSVTLAESAPHVVQAAEFQRGDFLALDWTTEPIPPLATGTVAFSDFDVLIVRYRWPETAGADLDTRTSLIGTGDVAIDGLELGFSRATELPGMIAPRLQWGGDNTSAAGVEATAVDFRQLALDYPAATELRLRLRAYWYGERRGGDIELELATYGAGAVSLEGNDLICAGPEISSAVVARHCPTQIPDPGYAGDDLGELVYSPFTRDAVLLQPA